MAEVRVTWGGASSSKPRRAPLQCAPSPTAWPDIVSRKIAMLWQTKPLRIARLPQLISLFVMALSALSPLPPQSAAASEASSPNEVWMVYGGDMTTRSAMNVRSVRRDGSIAHNEQVVVGLTGPLKAGARDFDYVLLDVDYDCEAITTRSVRARFFNRAGELLWSDALTDPARSAEHSSQARYYMGVACDPIDVDSVPNRASSLADVFGAQIWWKRQ